MHIGPKGFVGKYSLCYNEGMKKQVITLAAVLSACATVATAEPVKVSLRGGIRNLHRQGVVGLAHGNTGSVLSRYGGVKPVPFPRSTHVGVTVRGGAKNHHQQGVNRLIRGKHETTLSEYHHRINPAVVQRQVMKKYELKSHDLKTKTYEIRVPNENGGFDVYEHAPDGTITLKEP